MLENVLSHDNTQRDRKTASSLFRPFYLKLPSYYSLSSSPCTSSSSSCCADQFKMHWKNLSSHVRARNSVPRALEFKVTLWPIMLSQFFRRRCKGSYHIDDAVDLLEFLEAEKAASKKVLEAGEEVLFEERFLYDNETAPLDDAEMESLVYLSSYITRTMSKRYTLCNACKAYLKDKPIEENDKLLQWNLDRAVAAKPLGTSFCPRGEPVEAYRQHLQELRA